MWARLVAWTNGHRNQLRYGVIVGVALAIAVATTWHLIQSKALWQTFDATNTIFVSPPTMFARERMLNQQISEEQALQAELKDVAANTEGIQRAVNINSAKTIMAQLGVDGAAAPQPTSPEAKEANTAPVDPKVSLLETFQNRDYMRSRLNEALAANEFDDSQALDGRSLYRFQFFVSLLPPPETDAAAHIEIAVTQPAADTQYVRGAYSLVLAGLSVLLNTVDINDSDKSVGDSPEHNVTNDTAEDASIIADLSEQQYFNRLYLIVGKTPDSDQECDGALISDNPPGHGPNCVMLVLAAPTIKTGDVPIYRAAAEYAMIPNRNLLAIGGVTAVQFHNILTQPEVRSVLWPNKKSNDCDGASYYGASRLNDTKGQRSFNALLAKYAQNIDPKNPPHWEDPVFLYHVAKQILRNEPETSAALKTVSESPQVDPYVRGAATRALAHYRMAIDASHSIVGWFEGARIRFQIACKIRDADYVPQTPDERLAAAIEQNSPEMPRRFIQRMVGVLQSPVSNVATITRMRPDYRTVDEQRSILNHTQIGVGGAIKNGAGDFSGSAGLAKGGGVQGIVSRTSIIGFNESGNTSGKSGWILYPDQNAAGTVDRWVQRERTEMLSADMLIPSWWTRVGIKGKIFWADSTGRPIGESKTVQYSKPLPLALSDFKSLAHLVGSISTFQGHDIDARLEPADQIINVCNPDAVLLIAGQNLWHSPQVFVGGEEANNVAVLPNMGGLAAHFDASKFNQLGLSGKLPVVVVTSNGTKTIVNAIQVQAPAQPNSSCQRPAGTVPTAP